MTAAELALILDGYERDWWDLDYRGPGIYRYMAQRLIAEGRLSVNGARQLINADPDTTLDGEPFVSPI